jgi:hypothetical protein
MKKDNYMIFNRVFSRNTLNGFLNNESPIPYTVAIKRSSIDTNNKTNEEIISEIYQYMANYYRNEYVYKNTLLNHFLINNKKYNVNNTIALTEIPVGKSKADFILINGHAEIYEIKTGLDNFDKLEAQIQNYYKAFDRVSIVTSPDKQNDLENLLRGSKAGMYILDKKMKINEIKPSKCERQYLEHTAIFKILRKNEYENIIKSFGELPDVSQFCYYKECLKMFCKIDIKKVYSCFLSEMKKRYVVEKKYFLNMPESLKSLVYFSNKKNAEIEKLSKYLSLQYICGGTDVLSIS